MTSPLRSTFVALTTLLAASSLAAADNIDSGTATSDEVRTGATFGVDLNGGYLGCSTDDGDDCDGDGAHEAFGLDLRAGAMITPRLALMGELWGMAHKNDNVTVTQGIAAGVVRGWLFPRLWAEGGVGVARASAKLETGIGDFMTKTDYVPAAVAGVGVEVISTPGFALDVALKAGSGLYRDDISLYNVSLGVGVSAF